MLNTEFRAGRAAHFREHQKPLVQTEPCRHCSPRPCPRAARSNSRAGGPRATHGERQLLQEVRDAAQVLRFVPRSGVDEDWRRKARGQRAAGPAKGPPPRPPPNTHGPRCRTARICSGRRRAARSPAPSPASRSAPGPRRPRTRLWARRAAGTSATRWGRSRLRCSSGRPPARTYETATAAVRGGAAVTENNELLLPLRLTAGPGPTRRAAATPRRPPSCRAPEPRFRPAPSHVSAERRAGGKGACRAAGIGGAPRGGGACAGSAELWRRRSCLSPPPPSPTRSPSASSCGAKPGAATELRPSAPRSPSSSVPAPLPLPRRLSSAPSSAPRCCRARRLPVGRRRTKTRRSGAAVTDPRPLNGRTSLRPSVRPGGRALLRGGAATRR